MKMNRYQWLCASTFVLVIGCGSPDPKIASDSKEPSTPSAATTTPSAPDRGKSTKSDTKPDAAPAKAEAASPSLPPKADNLVPVVNGKPRPDIAATGLTGAVEQAKKMDKVQVPQLDQSDWHSSDRTPVQIANLADSAVASLKGAAAESSMQVKNAAGIGQTLSHALVQDPSHYSIEYIELVSGEPHTMIAKADGKRRGVLIASTFVKQGGWLAKAPVGDKGSISVGNPLVAQWPTQFPRLAFAPLTESQGSFSAYLSALSSKAGGYTVKSEKRVVPFNGRVYTSYRILAQQAATGTRIEMVFDGNYNLPVTIRASLHPAKGKPSDMLWGTRWKFHQSIPAKTFEMPEKLG